MFFYFFIASKLLAFLNINIANNTMFKETMHIVLRLSSSSMVAIKKEPIKAKDKRTIKSVLNFLRLTIRFLSRIKEPITKPMAGPVAYIA